MPGQHQVQETRRPQPQTPLAPRLFALRCCSQAAAHASERQTGPPRPRRPARAHSLLVRGCHCGRGPLRGPLQVGLRKV
eukprot:352199-Chlamydomonas_euryale.AAC.1